MNNGTPEEPKKEEPPKKQVVWHQKTTFLIIALLSVGPFALPLLWANPRYSMANKILWTLITLALTFVLVSYSVTAVQTLMRRYKELGLGL